MRCLFTTERKTLSGLDTTVLLLVRVIFHHVITPARAQQTLETMIKSLSVIASQYC